MIELPIFVTGNQQKLLYLSRQLGVQLEHSDMDLEEIQSNSLKKIVDHKLKQAYAFVQAPVLVEDVSLEFTALGDMPGPYIKWFLESAGEDACCRMLDGFSDRGALIRCIFGYYDSTNVHFFESTMHGTISQKPEGDNGFGFDRIFIMDGYDAPRATLAQDVLEKTYAQDMKPFQKVKNFLMSTYDV